MQAGLIPLDFLPHPEQRSLYGFREKSCAKKVRYPSKHLAEKVRDKALHRRKRHPRYLRAYHCGICNGWHLTKQEDSDQNET